MVLPSDSGHGRVSGSWLINRLFRDITSSIDQSLQKESPHSPWPPPRFPTSPAINVRAASPSGAPIQNNMDSQSFAKRPVWEPLRVSVYRVIESPSPDHGVPSIDAAWLSGFAVICGQLMISVIPWSLDGGWHVPLITICGTILALWEASLPQWRKEKWSCPRRGGQTVALTAGNGTRHVVIIENDRSRRSGLNFEVLARATRLNYPSWYTRISIVALAVMWMFLLVTVAGIKDQTWCKLTNSAKILLLC